MAVPIAAAAAGAVAAAAYVDAKWHIRKDFGQSRRVKDMEKRLQETARTERYCLWYYFEETVKSMPASTQCIWSRNGCYNWQETYVQSNKFAQYFARSGLRPNNMIAFYLTNTPDFAFTLLGTWQVGCGAGLINFNLSGESLVHCIKVSRAKTLVVDGDEDCRARIEEVRERLEKELGMTIIVLDGPTKREIESMSSEPVDASYQRDMKPESPMCLLYTSGSTGMPKACPFPTARGTILAAPRTSSLGLKSGPNCDRWYDCMPMYHGTGGTVAMTCLLSGITLCIGKRFSTSRFWEDIRDSKATAFVYVGETARYLLSTPPSPLDRQHNVRVMYGNGMRPDVWEKFQNRFGIETVGEFFNSSEGVFALLNVSKGPYLQNAVGHHGAYWRWKLRDTYVPVEVDHESGGIWRDPKTGLGKRKPYEEGGEMLVRMENESGFTGYYGNDEATAKKFERNVLKKGDLYYRTGDALRRTTDGRWYFLDRLGDTYRWKSENVSTAEVSEVLGRFAGVQEAIVYGVEVPGHDGKAGCAAVSIDPSVPQASYPQFFNELYAHAQRNMPKYAVPVFIRILKSASTMHNNKQNKIPLKKDGINLDMIYGEGNDVDEAREQGKDVMLWSPAAVGQGSKSDALAGYVLFRRDDWDKIRSGGQPQHARL
ncbi:acetyl-CoA synthetase-like protein [Rhizodiscina lignyota]|uniref:Very long-chain fatty acid transport protein n=1 Tax=Rhizodiscina lignyota TaxID=1504668 RepID=A0A9P4IDJ2_9PEZI|nr:acetyl-CoA synthetase-like protein [Rhizodiscina lignyota]